jgi:hypothetical protein
MRHPAIFGFPFSIFQFRGQGEGYAQISTAAESKSKGKGQKCGAPRFSIFHIRLSNSGDREKVTAQLSASAESKSKGKGQKAKGKDAVAPDFRFSIFDFPRSNFQLPITSYHFPISISSMKSRSQGVVPPRNEGSAQNVI